LGVATERTRESALREVVTKLSATRRHRPTEHGGGFQ
jgi:hypothetical protein